MTSSKHPHIRNEAWYADKAWYRLTEFEPPHVAILSEDQTVRRRYIGTIDDDGSITWQMQDSPDTFHPITPGSKDETTLNKVFLHLEASRRAHLTEPNPTWVAGGHDGPLTTLSLGKSSWRAARLARWQARLRSGEGDRVRSCSESDFD